MSGLTGSTKRKVVPPYKGQKGRCSWCGTTDLPKGRTSWCSDACVQQYLMRSSPDYIRREVFKRDRGICQMCGCNADAEYRRWQEASKELSRLTERLITTGRWHEQYVNGRWLYRDSSFPSHQEIMKFRRYMKSKYPLANWTSGRYSGWDADHIIPVIEGGGECGIENYRTLCHPCHKIVTAELAARRAKARSKQKNNDNKS